MVKAIWARAFAEAEGDDSKSKAFYIRGRVAELTTNKINEDVHHNRKIEHDGTPSTKNADFGDSLFGPMLVVGLAVIVVVVVLVAGAL